MLVLIVDDDATNLFVLDQFVQAAGFPTVTATNGMEAIDVYLRDRPDLVLMDLSMPVMDGFEATKRIFGAAEPAQKRPMILAVSANVTPEAKASCMDIGMHDFIEKPIDFEKLIPRIKQLSELLAGQARRARITCQRYPGPKSAMSLLLDIRHPEWIDEQDLRQILQPQLPGVEILCGLNDGDLSTVRMAAVARLFPGVASRLPGLELVQKLGAGVESIVDSPELPAHVRVTRLAGAGAAEEIAEYCLAYVLAGQRNMAAHHADAARGVWRQRAPKVTGKTTVAVLGLGHIGGLTARLFARLGFRVLGWSRTLKSIAEVACHAGCDGLRQVLAHADYVAAILPSTPGTRDLFDASLLSKMKPGATLINVGRGDLIVEQDLLAALDNGPLEHAVLDVLRTEPLPPDHPFWRHGKITVTPHVSGWRLDDVFDDVAENYRRLVQGAALLNEIDRKAGY